MHANHNKARAAKIFKIFVAQCSKLNLKISDVRCGNKYWLARNTSAPTMTTTGIGNSVTKNMKKKIIPTWNFQVLLLLLTFWVSKAEFITFV